MFFPDRRLRAGEGPTVLFVPGNRQPHPSARRAALDATKNPQSPSPPPTRTPARAPGQPRPAPGSEPARSKPGRAPVQTRAAGTAARSHRSAARTCAERPTSARARSPRRAHVARRRDTHPTTRLTPVWGVAAVTRRTATVHTYYLPTIEPRHTHDGPEVSAHWTVIGDACGVGQVLIRPARSR